MSHGAGALRISDRIRDVTAAAAPFLLPPAPPLTATGYGRACDLQSRPSGWPRRVPEGTDTAHPAVRGQGAIARVLTDPRWRRLRYKKQQILRPLSDYSQRADHFLVLSRCQHLGPSRHRPSLS